MDIKDVFQEGDVFIHQGDTYLHNGIILVRNDRHLEELLGNQLSHLLPDISYHVSKGVVDLEMRTTKDPPQNIIYSALTEAPRMSLSLSAETDKGHVIDGFSVALFESELPKFGFIAVRKDYLDYLVEVAEVPSDDLRFNLARGMISVSYPKDDPRGFIGGIAPFGNALTRRVKCFELSEKGLLRYNRTSFSLSGKEMHVN